MPFRTRRTDAATQDIVSVTHHLSLHIRIIEVQYIVILVSGFGNPLVSYI